MPPDLDSLIVRALASRPDERHGSAAEVFLELDALAAQRGYVRAVGLVALGQT